jgi:hypothetical protein
LKLLVWEEAASVNVAYTPPKALADRYEVTGKEPLLAAMDRALEILVATVSAD